MVAVQHKTDVNLSIKLKPDFHALSLIIITWAWS